MTPTAANAIVIDFPSPTEAMTRAESWPDKARALAITDADSYQKGAEYLQGVKALRREIAETFKAPKQKLDEAKRALLEQERKKDQPLAEAERIIKDGLVAYDTEQERIRREEEARLQREAQAREEQRQLDEAAALEAHAVATGDVALRAEAEALATAPVAAPVVTVAKATPKVAGMAYRETWSARTTDLLALARHIAAHPEHVNLILPNQTAQNALARAQRRAQLVPGVVGICTRDVAARRV